MAGGMRSCKHPHMHATLISIHGIIIIMDIMDLCTVDSSICREFANGLKEFQCHLEMDSDVFKTDGGVTYKYVVSNSQQEDTYEYLHGLPSNYGHIRNRWLLKGM